MEAAFPGVTKKGAIDREALSKMSDEIRSESAPVAPGSEAEEVVFQRDKAGKVTQKTVPVSRVVRTRCAYGFHEWVSTSIASRLRSGK